MKRIASLILIVGLLSACGTIRTLGEGPVKLPVAKNDEDFCQSITRIYSGIQYDYCFVNDDDGSNWELFNILFWDFPFSFVLDTAVLPYTIVRQIISGNIGEPAEPKDAYQ
ncbi:MAG: YceK/YidQ family lipoprotein [Oleiphilaceae bacterium]|nr:YceK/YidQ family lipoprotein [Oleiphilaceae bacterium]